MKKNGKLRIVHDLQPLNKVTVRDAELVPILDDFVEGFAGRQCYTVFDLYWGFDARRMEPESRDMTAFMTPLGLLPLPPCPLDLQIRLLNFRSAWCCIPQFLPTTQLTSLSH
jgi:hypothetical protein